MSIDTPTCPVCGSENINPATLPEEVWNRCLDCRDDWCESEPQVIRIRVLEKRVRDAERREQKALDEVARMDRTLERILRNR